MKTYQWTAESKKRKGDPERLRALRFEARGKAWLWRNELPVMAYDAYYGAVDVSPVVDGDSFEISYNAL